MQDEFVGITNKCLALYIVIWMQICLGMRYFQVYYSYKQGKPHKKNYSREVVLMQNSAAALSIKFKPAWMLSFFVFGTGLDFQLIFKFIKGWLPWGLQAAYARLPSPLLMLKKFLHIFLSDIYNKNMCIICSSSDSDRQTDRQTQVK